MFKIFERKQTKQLEQQQKTEIKGQQDGIKYNIAERKINKIGLIGDIEVVDLDKKVYYASDVALRDLRCLDPVMNQILPVGFYIKNSYLQINLFYISAIITDRYSLISENKQDLAQKNLQALSDVLKQNKNRTDGAQLSSEGVQLQYIYVLHYCLQQVTQNLEQYIEELEASTRLLLSEIRTKTTAYNLEILRRVKIYISNLQETSDQLQDCFEKFLYNKGNIDRLAQLIFKDDLEDNQEVLTYQLQVIFETKYIKIADSSQKIQTLSDYVEFADEIVGMELDNHRNIILQIEVLLALWGAVMLMLICVVGIFNQNLDSGVQTQHNIFYKVVGISVAIIIVILLAMVYFLKQNGFLTFHFKLRTGQERLKYLNQDLYQNDFNLNNKPQSVQPKI